MEPDQFGVPTEQVTPGDTGFQVEEPGSRANNNGQEPDLSAFWDGNEEGGQETQLPDASVFSQNLQTQLQEMQFGGDLITPEMSEDFANGNFRSFNERFQTQMREAARQQTLLNFQVIRYVRDHLLADVRREMSGTLQQRDDSDYLGNTFPSARDPRTRPQVEAVFRQAMKLANGNRQKATDMTKVMLKTMADTFGRDTGQNNSRDDSGTGGVPFTLDSLLEA